MEKVIFPFPYEPISDAKNRPESFRTVFCVLVLKSVLLTNQSQNLVAFLSHHLFCLRLKVQADERLGVG